MISRGIGDNTNEVGLDQKARFALYRGIIKVDTIQIPLNVVSMKDYNDNLPLTPYVEPPSLLAYGQGTNADILETLSGSGGYYLSNEIFYRVAYLRNKFLPLNRDLKSGHIHVGFH